MPAAARQVPRCLRATQTEAWIARLRASGNGLTPTAEARVVRLRRLFLQLPQKERTALIPALLALVGADIHSLTQAKELWHTLSAVRRARAITHYLERSSGPERFQVLKLSLLALRAPELLQLLHFVTAQAHKWKLSEGGLLQSFLQSQPERLAALGEAQLIAALMELLPAATAARAPTLERRRSRGAANEASARTAHIAESAAGGSAATGAASAATTRCSVCACCSAAEVAPSKSVISWRRVAKCCGERLTLMRRGT